jgi:Putative auto-transporter adhesin, head GIN domain
MSTAPTTLHRRRAPRLHHTLAGLAVLVLAAILVGLLVSRHTGAAGTGSGVAATQGRSLPRFTRVTLSGTNNLVVHVGPRQSVIVHADDNLLERVTTHVRGGRLLLGTSAGQLRPKTPMFVVVTLPTLRAITLRGSGNIAATGVHGRSLAVTLPGSGTISVTGSTSRLEVAAAGAGTVLLHQLVARDARAALAGDGTIMLTATSSLQASVSGSGTILYGGSPAHVVTSVTGTGTITPG